MKKECTEMIITETFVKPVNFVCYYSFSIYCNLSLDNQAENNRWESDLSFPQASIKLTVATLKETFKSLANSIEL